MSRLAFDLARRSALLALLASSVALGAGCAVQSAPEEDPIDASTDAIVDINNSRVKHQSIGNCWLYATASWADRPAIEPRRVIRR